VIWDTTNPGGGMNGKIRRGSFLIQDVQGPALKPASRSTV